MMANSVIEFQIDGPRNEGQLVYRPHGVRILKLKITSSKDIEIPLRLRPRRQEPPESPYFIGYADDHDTFIIQWGGGHENGPCLKAMDKFGIIENCLPFDKDDECYCFFLVTHEGPEVPPKATVTIEAFNEKDDKVHASLTIHLVRPANMPDEIIQFERYGRSRWMLSHGEYLPKYDPRWWPGEVRFEAVDRIPISIARVSRSLQVYWGDENRLIAKIADHSRPSVLLSNENLCFELFSFDRWHVALRIWFFWLDKNIKDARVYVGDFEVDGHEVPDAERFDFLIQKDTGRINLACTDQHWREEWGISTTSPQRATLGLGPEAMRKLAEGGYERVSEELREKMKLAVAKVLRREEQQESNQERIHNPMAKYIPRQARIIATRGRESVAGRGGEAHVPTLLEIEQIYNPETDSSPMSSSDVRRAK